MGYSKSFAIIAFSLHISWTAYGQEMMDALKRNREKSEAAKEMSSNQVGSQSNTKATLRERLEEKIKKATEPNALTGMRDEDEFIINICELGSGNCTGTFGYASFVLKLYVTRLNKSADVDEQLKNMMALRELKSIDLGKLPKKSTKSMDSEIRVSGKEINALVSKIPSAEHDADGALDEIAILSLELHQWGALQDEILVREVDDFKNFNGRRIYKGKTPTQIIRSNGAHIIAETWVESEVENAERALYLLKDAERVLREEEGLNSIKAAEPKSLDPENATKDNRK